MKKIQYACMLFTLWYAVTFGLALFVPAPVVASINSGFVFGAGNLTTTGAIPFQNGTTGTLTQNADLTFTSGTTLQVPANGVFKIKNSCSITDSGDGFIKFLNNATTGACTLIFGPGGGSSSSPDIIPVRQVNPYLILGDASGTNTTTNLRIPAQKATTGNVFLCIDTNGQLVKNAVTCTGT